MKTSLLFIIALFIGFSVYAQQAGKFTQANGKAKPTIQLNRNDTESNSSTVLPAYVPRTVKGTNMDVKKVYLGTSRNAFTLLVQEQVGVYYNKELNCIMNSYRGNNKAVVGLPAPVGTGNDVVTNWSTDMGTTQTTKISYVGVLNTSMARYPSGVIFNPAGNTDLNVAYSLVGGPATNAAGFASTFLSSIQYNGNNLDKDIIPLSDYTELVRQGMTVIADGHAYIGTTKEKNDGTNYTSLKSHVKSGVFNTNTLGFDWTQKDIDVPFYINGGFPDGYSYFNMAWSKDGSVGYMMNLGIDSRAGANKGYYPILQKTVDQGATWQLMDYFDFSTFPVVYDHIYPVSATPDIAVPWFLEADMVVDNSNNLHIMALCRGHARQNPDSLNYYYPTERGSIFEFSNEQGGQWFCHYIGQTKTTEVTGAESPYVTNPAPNVGWNMRLQASRTDDGSKVFAVWTDTDYQFWGMTDSINLYPDVMAWGRDVNTNMNTTIKNITYLQEGMGEAYFMFVSPIAIDNAGVYDIPTRISDINTSALNADEPVAHYYLQGVTFTEADFTILSSKDSPKAGKLSVNNYPNPFSGKTSFDVNLANSGAVSLVVNSITGQQVSSVNYGVMGAGSHTLTFDANNLTSGIYFYTLTIGDKKVTNKMVIK